LQQELIIKKKDEENIIALLEDGFLVELYLGRGEKKDLVGNIYKGRVENVLPGLEAGFIDFGWERNGYLYVGKNKLNKGEEVLVQVAKNFEGNKGPRLTQNISLAGRYIVLLPLSPKIAVSRRIEPEAKERLRNFTSLLPSPQMGIIFRTAARDATEKELKREIKELAQLWQEIVNKAKRKSAPVLLHAEANLIPRVLRDLLALNLQQITVNELNLYKEVKKWLKDYAPSLRTKLSFDKNDQLSIKYRLDEQIKEALERRVNLKSGGFLVIDQAEALTAIDVNSGKYVGVKDLEDTAYRTNLEAAYEIPRQLRLRNIGGIIIIDFIDMHHAHNRQEIIHILKEGLLKDRAKPVIAGITPLGLVEMTRRRQRYDLAATSGIKEE